MLNGHEHVYERFAPQLPDTTADPNGIRQFIVGTGGKSQGQFGTPRPNSTVRLTAFGVLELTLGTNAYSWRLVERERGDPRQRYRYVPLTRVTDRIRACLFDVFGTVVDWHTSVSRDLAAFAAERGLDRIDWVRVRRGLAPPLQPGDGGGPQRSSRVDHPGRAPPREPRAPAREYGIDGCTDADVDHMNRAWHRLDPWPDAVPGLHATEDAGT